MYRTEATLTPVAVPIRRVAAVLAGTVLACCSVGAEPSAIATPAPVASATLPPGDIGLGRFVDTRAFSVTFAAWSPDGEETARQLAGALPEAWTLATGGRGRVSVRADDADIHILVLNMPGLSTGGGRGITLRLPGTRVASAEVRVMLHEIAHSLGCCFGDGANAGGHWVACDPTGEIMCERGSRADRFSDRELRALRLLD
jgi:hypothetical protein